MLPDKSQDLDILVELPNVSKPPNIFCPEQFVTGYEIFGIIDHPVVFVIELVNSETTCIEALFPKKNIFDEISNENKMNIEYFILYDNI